MPPITLTIAGSDPSGGAGIQADLKTFHQFGTYGMSVVTLLTVQNTREVSDMLIMPADFIIAQIDALLDDLPPVAIKTGALGSAAVIDALADRLKDVEQPIVVDPVMVSKQGQALMDDDGVSAFIDRLLPLSYIVTPNRDEASRMLGWAVNTPEDMQRAARELRERGADHVVIKNGGDSERAVDVLLIFDEIFELEAPRLATSNTHGTGCAFAAAITARLAHGDTPDAAIVAAKHFVNHAINTEPKFGHGHGPINLHAKVVA